MDCLDLFRVEEVDPQRLDVGVRRVGGPVAVEADVIGADGGQFGAVLDVRVRVLALWIEDQLPDRPPSRTARPLGDDERASGDGLHRVRLAHPGHAEHPCLVADEVVDVDEDRGVRLPSRHRPAAGRGVAHGADADTIDGIAGGRLEERGDEGQPIADRLVHVVGAGGIEVVHIVAPLQPDLAVGAVLVERAEDQAVQPRERHPVLRVRVEAVEVEYR